MPYVDFKNMAIKTFADGSTLDTETGKVTPATNTPAPTPTSSGGGSPSPAPIQQDQLSGYLKTSSGQTVYAPVGSTMYNQYVQGGATALQANDPAVTSPNSTVSQVINNPSPDPGNQVTANTGEYQPSGPNAKAVTSPDGTEYMVPIDWQVPSGWKVTRTMTTSANLAELTLPNVETGGTSEVPLVEQQANELGNNVMANKEYVDGVFLQYHNRMPESHEYDRFVGKGVLDVHNAIKAGMPGQETTIPEETVTGGEQADTDVNLTVDGMTGSESDYTVPTAGDQYTGADIVAGTNVAVKSLEDYIAMLTPAQTEISQEYDGLKDKISSLLEQGIDRQTDQLKAEADLGLNQLRQDYAKLNADILRRTAEYESLTQGIEGKPITMSSIIGQQAQVQKMKASEIGLLQARALGLQGQIDTAQDIANRSVDLKYQTIETTLKVYEAQLNMIAEDLNKEEAIRMQAQQMMLADQKEAIAEKKAIEKNVQSIALLAMQNGADSGLIDQITKAKSEIEASKIAGQLLNTEGWTYVATPAERDRLKSLGYEITQAGGRTYAKPGTGASNPEVEAYVAQIRSGAMKIASVPANIRDQVVIALGSGGASGGGGGTTGGGGGSTASSQQGESQWDDQMADQTYQKYIDAGYSPYEASQRIAELSGFMPKNAEWDMARQFVADNAEADWNEVKSYLLQNTNLTATEINSLKR